MFSSSASIIACVSPSFLFVAEYCSIVWTEHVLSSHLWMFLSCFCLLAVASCAALNIFVQVIENVSVLLGIYMRVNFLANTKILFNFLKNHQTVFLSVCTILQSHRQSTRVPFSPHLRQHFFFFFEFFYSCAGGCKVVYHCRNNLQLL